jgi:hypothetical protein
MPLQWWRTSSSQQRLGNVDINWRCTCTTLSRTLCFIDFPPQLLIIPVPGQIARHAVSMLSAMNGAPRGSVTFLSQVALHRRTLVSTSLALQLRGVPLAYRSDFVLANPRVILDPSNGTLPHTMHVPEYHNPGMYSRVSTHCNLSTVSLHTKVVPM